MRHTHIFSGFFRVVVQPGLDMLFWHVECTGPQAHGLLEAQCRRPLLPQRAEGLDFVLCERRPH